MNTRFFQCLFTWRLPPASDDELQQADVIIAHSFGFQTQSPGPSNRALARVAHQLHLRLGIPIIAQHEIAHCLHDNPLYTIQAHRLNGKYLDTYEVLAQSNRECVRRGFSRPIIVAHPDHQWRVMRVARRLGLHPIPADVSIVRYNPRSAQWWTRCRELFLLREIPTRLFYWWVGKI